MGLSNPSAAPGQAGHGPPVSGPGGTPGAFLSLYGDIDFDPAVVYTQVSSNPTSPKWLALQAGDTT